MDQPDRVRQDLPTDPAQLPYVFAEAFNQRDLERFNELFDDEAVFVKTPGVVLGARERRTRSAAILEQRVPITVDLRHVYVAGDIALLINDFLHEGNDAGGTTVRQQGTATDVARRGADGVWRYLIDNPSGTDLT